MPWRGAAKREVFRHFVRRQLGDSDEANQARMDAAYRDFQMTLRECYSVDGVAVVPGAEAAFSWLRSHGVRVALMTGFDREIADILVGAADWRDRVDAVVTSDDVGLGRPAPYLIFHAMEATGIQDVRRVAVVGDTANDLLAGARAGVAGVISVLTGSQGIGRLGVGGTRTSLPASPICPLCWRAPSRRVSVPCCRCSILGGFSSRCGEGVGDDPLEPQEP